MKGSWARTLDPELQHEQLNNVVTVVIMSACSVRTCTLRLHCVTVNKRYTRILILDYDKTIVDAQNNKHMLMKRIPLSIAYSPIAMSVVQ